MSSSFRLYNLLKETFLLLDFGDRQLFEHLHLSVPRTYVLYHIASAPGITPGQLSERMFCDKSNITRLVQGLESEELVTRQPHESDGRATRLYLTASGLALAAQVKEMHERSVEARLRGLESDTADDLALTLARLNRELASMLTTSTVGSAT